MNEEIPRSLSLNAAPTPSPALIVGAKVALNSEGKLAEAEWKALAERLSMYSDKRYETARYFFVKDGTIVRQVAVSSQTPSATLAFPDEGYHWKLREWALSSEAKIVFCHNHPSGYTAPSEADERLTERLSNFFNGDGEEAFLGHVILDHGSFGLYTPESGWKHFGPRGLEEFGRDESGFFIRNWTPALSRKESYFPVANEKGLLLLAGKARELDALDSWNSKDWVPAILASKGGEIRSMEYANVAELKAPDLLLSRMKEAGRLHGAGDLYLFPINWDQAMLCRSFAAETNAVRGVCRLSESGEPDVSFHANAELFGAPKKSEIVVEDTEGMPEAKARLETMKENERMEKKERSANQNRDKLNFVLDKLSKAGIEVVTDKAEFDRILEQKKLVQKMADSAENKNAQRYHTENILQLNPSIGQYKDNFFGQESQEVLEKLDAYLTQIKNAEKPTKADEFLEKIQNIMHIDEEKSKTVRHFVGGKQNNLRISNHSANAVHARFRPNETSIVIKLSSTKFRPDTEAFLAEFVYESKNLTAEKQQGIINGLKDWLNTGDYTDKNFDKEFYSPSKELYLQMKQEQESGTKFFIHDNEIYGFAHGGKIYLNPDIMNSEAAIHEYTHLWDNYTQRTNPELWQKGKDIFKDTKLWNDVKADPNYGDIAGDDDLILSEVHARICGKMADEILSKIAERDGELKKDAAIDWDREVSEFVAKEFGAVPELGQEDHVSETVRAELLREFLSSPMKDLMSGLQITKGRETGGQIKEETVETEEDKLMAKKKEKAPARRKAKKPEETSEAPEAKAEAATGREGFKDEEASAEELYADFVEKMREGWASMKEKEEKGEEPEYASFAALFEGVGKSYSKAERVAISKKVAAGAGTESPAQASEWLEKMISTDYAIQNGAEWEFNERNEKVLKTPEPYTKEDKERAVENMRAAEKLEGIPPRTELENGVEDGPAEGLEEPAPAVQEGAAPVPEQEEELGVDALKKLLLEAQLRNDALNAKVSSLESVIASLQSQLAQLNAKLGAAQGREEPGSVQENASAAESGYGAPAQGQQAPSPDPNQFSTQTMYRPGIPVPKFGVKVGEDEFDIKEGCRFKELLKNKDNPAMNEVVLERETEDGTIEKVKIPEREYLRIASVHEKFERERSQHAADSYEWDYFHKKYGEEMGIDRNRTRMNTAANFLHNFKVWCRASAENPQDAMKIARDLVGNMSEWERARFNAMRNQWPAGPEDYDMMLVHVFEENSKLKGTAITADRRKCGVGEASMIYELNKDDIELKRGETIPGTHKRVGETVKLSMLFEPLGFKKFSDKTLEKYGVNDRNLKATPEITFEIIGCTKNLGGRNEIILASREHNTKYVLPLDPIVEKIVQQEKELKSSLKKESKAARKNAVRNSTADPDKRFENMARSEFIDEGLRRAYSGRGW